MMAIGSRRFQPVAVTLVLAMLTGCGDLVYIQLFPGEALTDAAIGADPDAAPAPPDRGVSDAGIVDAGTADAAVVDAGADATHDASADAPLVLRYDFEGTGTRVRDRVGEAHGRVIGGAELDGQGGLTLDGVDDYVNMPNGLLSRQTSVTIMAWLQWAGGPCWQRIFDFGNNDAGEDAVGNATSSLFLTPSSCARDVITGIFELESALHAANGREALPQGRLVQVALVFDGPRSTLTIYADGAMAARAAVPFQLAQLNDLNNWLGRSQWVQDHHLRGRFEELRIYAGPLGAEAIAAMHARGPDRP